jgi:hypothetical protein
MSIAHALRMRLLRVLSIAACRLRMRRRLPPVPRRNAIRGDRIRGASPERAPDGARSRAPGGFRKPGRRRERCIRTS